MSRGFLLSQELGERHFKKEIRQKETLLLPSPPWNLCSRNCCHLGDTIVKILRLSWITSCSQLFLGWKKNKELLQYLSLFTTVFLCSIYIIRFILQMLLEKKKLKSSTVQTDLNYVNKNGFREIEKIFMFLFILFFHVHVNWIHRGKQIGKL